MAEGIFRKMLTDRGLSERWSVSSAGTLDLRTSPASDEAVTVMAEQGIDISRHRSRYISKTILENANLILVMAEEHLFYLQEGAPYLSSRIHLLSDMAGVYADVEDPMGLEMEDYRLAAADIRSYLEKGFDQITRLAMEQEETGVPADNESGDH